MAWMCVRWIGRTAMSAAQWIGLVAINLAGVALGVLLWAAVYVAMY